MSNELKLEFIPKAVYNSLDDMEITEDEGGASYTITYRHKSHRELTPYQVNEFLYNLYDDETYRTF